MNSKSSVKLAPMVKNIHDIDGSYNLTTSGMGVGVKDCRELFKPQSLYELGSAGQIKSNKINKITTRENVKLAHENISKSIGGLN